MGGSLEEVYPEEASLAEAYSGEAYLEEVNPEEVSQEEARPEEVRPEGAHLAEVSLEEVGPSEAALGPRALGACPRAVEARVVPVDPSGPTLPLVPSHEGPSYLGEDPSLGVPWGPSLVAAHEDPKSQEGAVHGDPSLQEEGASPHKGPSLDDGGPNLEVEDPSPGEEILDLDPSLKRAAPLRVRLKLHAPLSSFLSPVSITRPS